MAAVSTFDNSLEAPTRWYQRRWLRVLLSLSLLVVLLSTLRFDPERWFESVRKVLWWPIALALLVRPLAVFAHAWHAALLLDSAGVGLSIREVWRVLMFGEMLSRFVPGNLGTIAYLAKLTRRVGDALIAQLLDRVLFLMLTLLLAASSLALAGYGLLGLLALVAFAGVVAAAYLLYAGLLRWQRIDAAHWVTIHRMLARYRRWAAPYTLASAASLVLMTAMFWLLVVACGGHLDVFESLAAVTLVTIGAALPVTVNGIGIREWVFVALLGTKLPSEEGVITLAATTYLVGFASALIGVIVWALMGQKGRLSDAES